MKYTLQFMAISLGKLGFTYRFWGVSMCFPDKLRTHIVHHVVECKCIKHISFPWNLYGKKWWDLHITFPYYWGVWWGSMEVVSEWRFQQLGVPINSNNCSIPHILSSFTLVIQTQDQDVHGPRAGPAMYPAGCAQQWVRALCGLRCRGNFRE